MHASAVRPSSSRERRGARPRAAPVDAKARARIPSVGARAGRPPQPAVAVETKRCGEIAVLVVRGRLTIDDVARFVDAASPAIARCRRSGAGMVVEVSAVRLVDGFGLRCLWGICEDLAHDGAGFVLAAPGAVFSELLVISGFDGFFRSHHDLESALDDLARSEGSARRRRSTDLPQSRRRIDGSVPAAGAIMPAAH